MYLNECSLIQINASILCRSKKQRPVAHRDRTTTLHFRNGCLTLTDHDTYLRVPAEFLEKVGDGVHESRAECPSLRTRLMYGLQT